MKAHIFTSHNLKDLLNHIHLEGYSSDNFLHDLGDLNKTLVDYTYEVLTACLEEYESLPLVEDYVGEYDTIYSVFGNLVHSARDMPDVRAQDIRVIGLPLEHHHEGRLSLIDLCVTALSRDERHPSSEFVYFTDLFIKLLEIQYLQPPHKDIQHILFTRYQSALVVFIH